MNQRESLLDELDLDDEHRSHQATLTALLVFGAENARSNRLDLNTITRFYLCRSELMPNPRVGTPWQCLYESRADRAFITTMGFDVQTFEWLLNEAGFAEQWNSSPILRTDTNPMGTPRVGARSLDAAGGLGLYLHWLCSTMRETSLQQIFALVPATVSRYLAFSQRILLEVLREVRDAEICWPTRVEEYERLSALVQASDAKGLYQLQLADGNSGTSRLDTDFSWAHSEVLMD